MTGTERKLTVVGLDLSLTCSGVATDQAVHLCKSVGKKDDTLHQRADRLRGLARQVLELAEWADLVAVEAPVHGLPRELSGHQHDRSGLWWLVVCGLRAAGVAVAEISPASLKKYATGKGNADKDTVLAEAVSRFPALGIRNNNQADAHWLRAMALDQVAQPLCEMPATNRKSLQAVKWPEIKRRTTV